MTPKSYENPKSKYREVDSALSFKDFQLLNLQKFFKIAVTILLFNSYLNFCDEISNKVCLFCNEIVPSILILYSTILKTFSDVFDQQKFVI